MHLVVCVHAIVDPEIPADRFDVDPETGEARVMDPAPVMGPYDENALECALKVHDALPDTRVTALTHGEAGGEEILRRALAAGATDAVLVTGTPAHHDAVHVATVLAGAVRALGNVDAVLLGLEGGEWDTRQTPFALAEVLRWPVLSQVSSVEVAGNGQLRLVRSLEDATEWVLVPTPVVASVTNDAGNALRMARVRDVLSARRRALTRLAPDPGADAVKVERVTPAPRTGGSCVIIEGPSGEAKGRALAERLLAERIL